VRMTVAVAVVAEASSGTWNTVEATGTDTRSDVVGDAVDVQLTKIITVSRDDPVRSAYINQFVYRHRYIRLKQSNRIRYTLIVASLETFSVTR